MQLTKRSSLFILAGIAATSGILFATNQAFRRWSHSTGTTSMSNSIHVESLQAEAKTANPNTAQTTLFGSDKIGISSTISLQDDGQSTIFYPQSTKTGDRQNFIIPWLTAPAQDKDLEQFLVKKATFYVQGDAFILKNGASLAPHFDAYNARIAASGSDLIIYANPTKT
jgi:hypothetical protein